MSTANKVRGPQVIEALTGLIPEATLRDIIDWKSVVQVQSETDKSEQMQSAAEKRLRKELKKRQAVHPLMERVNGGMSRGYR